MEEHAFSVELGKIIKEFNLEVICATENYEKIKIVTNEVNRPSMQITGFFDYFYNDRIQVIGRVEFSYLEKLTPQERHSSLEKLFEKDIPCLIVARDMDIFPEMTELSKQYKTPVLRTANATSRFISALIAFLNVELAPRQTIHGVLVEV